MTKQQLQRILEFIQTIRQAQSANLYADCQEGAIAVGEFIEEIAGEDTSTVSLLEEYCELLFQASNGEVGEKKLKQHLIKIENSVRSELKPNRIEIAFLSHKASMSDSIESIYLAAKADPACDAYWIPIPYFDRNPDGSFSEKHYEGAEIYENIECTDWQQYDIKTRRPDAIVTFAPYDSANFVTSIHPDFYCEKLQSLTDCLVYVPYYVSSRPDYTAEHLITLPGCAYAHKVFLQSEPIRERYISVIKKQFGNNFGKPEDKFIALGSPKFDKVINTERDSGALPDDLAKLADGRRIIFYNTSLGTMLKWDELYLEKLRSVHTLFRERNDVLLWWRPHPLSEQALSSMRPGTVSEYKGIVKRYLSEGWGIYDDTADLHQAIAWSDAYYGDWSSVIALFGAVNKPVLVQGVEMVGRSEEEAPTYYVFEKEAEDLTKWLDDFGSVEPTVPFDECSSYKYMDGTSGSEIYKYIMYNTRR